MLDAVNAECWMLNAVDAARMCCECWVHIHICTEYIYIYINIFDAGCSMLDAVYIYIYAGKMLDAVWMCCDCWMSC